MRSKPPTGSQLFNRLRQCVENETVRQDTVATGLSWALMRGHVEQSQARRCLRAEACPMKRRESWAGMWIIRAGVLPIA